ncbi:Mu transposase domain-containing protein [Pendulispora albinea]|uniref:Transposase for insertion sequence element IS21-like C-terminal domain-containing protein n=1 Tax=Pendulispora albinea TaxID=2741071 RepID=A0ABZ2LLM9_9BACT
MTLTMRLRLTAPDLGASDLFKRALDQALSVRGSRDFESVEAYVTFVQTQVVAKKNARSASRLIEERKHLRPLPLTRLPEYTTHHLRVTCWSTITVGSHIYSVPSRLMNHEVEARRYADIVESWLGDDLLEAMPRIRGEKGHRIDYRHVIWSLVKKPGAWGRGRERPRSSSGGAPARCRRV